MWKWPFMQKLKRVSEMHFANRGHFPKSSNLSCFLFLGDFVETQDLAKDWLCNAWIVWCFHCEFLLEKISPKKLGLSGQKLSKVADSESFPNATNCALQVSHGMYSYVFLSCHHEDNAVLNVILKFPHTILILLLASMSNFMKGKPCFETPQYYTFSSFFFISPTSKAT